MGSKLEINWVLKLGHIPTNLNKLVEEGTEIPFAKDSERYFTSPIFLADPNWTVLAAVEITKQAIIPGNKTTGAYRVVKVLNENERIVLTKLYRELYSH